MTGKDCYQQMNLLGEWGLDRPTWEGADVFCARTGKVSREWLSACKEERALTVDLMEKVCDLSNLTTAMQKVVKNRGSSGIDKMKTTELRKWFQDHYQELQGSLIRGTYQPTAVKLVEIRKPKGGYRQLGIPTVIDRLVHQSIHQVLSQLYDRSFSNNSFGFRPQRGAHKALRKASGIVKEGKGHIVDLDIEKFFDRVNHDRLMWLLGTRIGDKRLLRLIGKILRSGIMHDGIVSQQVSGTPQGSPLSPLLSNIILDELDKELERRGHSFVRYADDLLVFLGSKEAAIRVNESLITFIERGMLLKVNRKKSQVCKGYQVNFLGHTLLKDGTLGLSKESEKQLKQKVREVTRRNRGISLEVLIKELNTKLRGWLNYFYMAKMKHRLDALESWIRRRVRCFRLKQSKRFKGMIKLLMNLGVPKHRCIPIASSHRGWYRKAASPQAHEGMNLAWFSKVGLYSLLANYLVLNLKKPPYTRVRTVV